MTDASSPIASPCIQVCNLDAQTDQCWGCGRSRREIAGWTALSPAEREALMAVLPQRVEAMRQALKDKINPPR